MVGSNKKENTAKGKKRVNKGMHFYWRIIEELKYLNENWIIKDPTLLRAYEKWVLKNSGTISMITCCFVGVKKGVFQYRGLPCSVN